MFDSGAGHLQVTRQFKIKSTSIEISAVAKVDALEAQDPFHRPGPVIKLIKATQDTSITVPELSIGGQFSVDGSANFTGCDRIMSQFVLTRFPAPPANPVPTFSNAVGGSDLIAPVAYLDTPNHPWSSGCFPIFSSNVIQGGDLVAHWSSVHCFFPGDFFQPKVRDVPFWDSTPFNGRFVILLEVRDRAVLRRVLPGRCRGSRPGCRLDRQSVNPIGKLTSIGGITGCGDLHLKDYVGTTAPIVGVAWDWPIDPTAPQQKPNDNFGGYTLTFQKNGVVPGVPIAVPPAPQTRVPNIWPGPLAPGTVGVLTDWNIVADLDGGPGPLPPGSPKLARGDRCAYVITLVVSDTTHVGDSGNNHSTGPVLYAINVINDIP